MSKDFIQIKQIMICFLKRQRYYILTVSLYGRANFGSCLPVLKFLNIGTTFYITFKLFNAAQNSIHWKKKKKLLLTILIY